MGCARRERVRVGAVVQVEGDDGHRSWLAVFPGGDATVLRQEERSLRVLSATSPLARALSGLAAGDSVEVDQGGEDADFEVLTVL
jgi:transcription elongation GreA/GreB family factor